MSRKPAVIVPSEIPSDRRYFNVKTAAEYLGIAIAAVRHKLVYSKAVPYARIGRRIIFERADLDRFFDNQRNAA